MIGEQNFCGRTFDRGW